MGGSTFIRKQLIRGVLAFSLVSILNANAHEIRKEVEVSSSSTTLTKNGKSLDENSARVEGNVRKGVLTANVGNSEKEFGTKPTNTRKPIGKDEMRNGQATSGDPSTTSITTADNKRDNDNKVVRSLLQQLTSNSNEPLIFIPRPHVQTKSLWSQHYERAPYRASYFRSTGLGRHKTNDLGSEKEVVPEDGIVLTKSELVQRRLNSIRIAKLFPDIHLKPARDVEHNLPEKGKESSKDSKVETNPEAMVVEETPVKIEEDSTLTRQENQDTEIKVEPTTVATPAETNPPVTVSSFFSWPPCWWPFKCVGSTTESPAEPSTTPKPTTESPTTEPPSTLPPPMLAQAHPTIPPAVPPPEPNPFHFIQVSTLPPTSAPEPPTPIITQSPSTTVTPQSAPSNLQFIPVNLNPKPIGPQDQSHFGVLPDATDEILIPIPVQFQPIVQDHEKFQNLDVEAKSNSPGQPVQMVETSTEVSTTTIPATTRMPTEPSTLPPSHTPPREQTNFQFIPVNPKTVESQNKNVLALATESGASFQQILIPVPIQFLPADEKFPEFQKNSAPNNKAPLRNSPVEPPRMVEASTPVPTTRTTTTTPSPTEPPTPTTTQGPAPPALQGYEIRFVPVPNEAKNDPQPQPNKIQPIDRPPRFRQIQILSPNPIVNSPSARFLPDGNLPERFRAVSNVKPQQPPPPIPKQPPVPTPSPPNVPQDQANRTPGKFRPDPSNGSPSQTRSTAQGTTKTLKNGARVLPNGVVVPAGFKCPYGK